MGLITKGLLAAGAVYAVKGVNKSSERRDEKRQQQQQQQQSQSYYSSPQGQGYEYRGASPRQGGPYSAPQGYGYDNRDPMGQQYRGQYQGEGNYQLRQGPPPQYQSSVEASQQQQRSWERSVEEGPNGWSTDAKR